jgi:hypothetical protein
VVEVFAFVVIPLGTDNSGASSGFDGVRVDVVGGGGFGEGEHALAAEPVAAGGDAVGADDVVDDEPVEGLFGAAAEAALVEDGGDLAAGVLVEELVDGGDDFRRGAAGFGAGLGNWQGQGVVLAAA